MSKLGKKVVGLVDILIIVICSHSFSPFIYPMFKSLRQLILLGKVVISMIFYGTEENVGSPSCLPMLMVWIDSLSYILLKQKVAENVKLCLLLSYIFSIYPRNAA